MIGGLIDLDRVWRRALTQSEHERWNADNYPGTRQLCADCGEPTGRCEEDSYWNDDGEAVCEDCYALGEGGSRD